MTNYEVHVFKTRRGTWNARITCRSFTEYVGECKSIFDLMVKAARILIIHRKDA